MFLANNTTDIKEFEQALKKAFSYICSLSCDNQHPANRVIATDIVQPTFSISFGTLPAMLVSGQIISSLINFNFQIEQVCTAAQIVCSPEMVLEVSMNVEEVINDLASALASDRADQGQEISRCLCFLVGSSGIVPFFVLSATSDYFAFYDPMRGYYKTTAAENIGEMLSKKDYIHSLPLWGRTLNHAIVYQTHAITAGMKTDLGDPGCRKSRLVEFFNKPDEFSPGNASFSRRTAVKRKK